MATTGRRTLKRTGKYKDVVLPDSGYLKVERDNENKLIDQIQSAASESYFTLTPLEEQVWKGAYVAQFKERAKYFSFRKAKNYG